MENDFNEKLELFRAEVDEIDRVMLDLLNKRAGVFLKIKNLKLKHNRPLYDSKREEALLNSIIKHNNGSLSSNNIIQIFNSILKNMKS